MRWLAAVMIVLCSWLTAQSAADKLHRRKRFLDRLSEFVRLMSAQISYALVPLDRIIRERDDGEGGFFHCCIKQMDDGVPANHAWMQAVEICSDVRALKKDEQTLVCELGGQLGVYDAELQISSLKHFADQLEVYCREASTELSEKNKLYTTCSLLGGVLLSILII